MKQNSIHRLKLDYLLMMILMTCVDAIRSHMGSLLYGSRPRTYNAKFPVLLEEVKKHTA